MEFDHVTNQYLYPDRYMYIEMIPQGPRRIVISEFNQMHWGHFNLRMRGCPQASNIHDDPTSKYSTINIISRIAQSVEWKTDIREVPSSLPHGSKFFSLSHFIHLLLLKLLLETQRMQIHVCWICMWRKKFSSFSMNHKIWVYPVINIKKKL
jgi:hypothetical protein